MSREGGKRERVVCWEGGKCGGIVRRQGWRGWRALTWQVRKGKRRVGGEEVAKV